MRKSFIFMMVGLAYIVIAMAASWANTSNALDKTLEIIGISQETETSTIQYITDDSETKTEKETRVEREQKNTDTLKKQTKNNTLLAYYVPVPPPGSPGTDPKD